MLDFTGLTDETLILEIPRREEIASKPMIGSTHGSILSALIDLTGLYTINALRGSASASADILVDFHLPALRGRCTKLVEVSKSARILSWRSHGAKGMIELIG
ncbi:hotdog fold thioesterase [Novosphingobium kunmingense]|uniref:hotdog fold thioesterase n=1 Tax=Novosphingobium kunmingense TaxID=1211806 RepID=UPI0018E1EF7A|nr:hotdog fold thioesterase [Novosphingobium kunmingense]